jgi:hypothetical protein
MRMSEILRLRYEGVSERVAGAALSRKLMYVDRSCELRTAQHCCDGQDHGRDYLHHEGQDHGRDYLHHEGKMCERGRP